MKDHEMEPLLFTIAVMILIWLATSACWRLGQWTAHVNGMERRIQWLEQEVRELSKGAR